MPQHITLVLTPKQAADATFYTSQAARRMGVSEADIALVRVVKRSIDARQRQVKVNLTLEVYVDREPQPGRCISTIRRSTDARRSWSWDRDLRGCSRRCG